MKAVLDTNVVIYLQKGLVAEVLPPGVYAISVITEMELLSFQGLTEQQRTCLRRFIEDMTVVEIDDDIKEHTIALRLEHRLKLPDAIVAATAITRQAILFSNDQGLAGLSGIDLRSVKLRR